MLINKMLIKNFKCIYDQIRFKLPLHLQRLPFHIFAIFAKGKTESEFKRFEFWRVQRSANHSA